MIMFEIFQVQIKNAKLPLPKSLLFDVVSEVNLFMVMKNTCYS